VLAGDIDLKREHALIDHARKWIEAHAKDTPGLSRYLEAWGDWKSPF
jgi:hypothetical protein